MEDKDKTSSITKLLRILLLILLAAVLFYLGTIIGKRAKQAQQPEAFEPSTPNEIISILEV